VPSPPAPLFNRQKLRHYSYQEIHRIIVAAASEPRRGIWGMMYKKFVFVGVASICFVSSVWSFSPANIRCNTRLTTTLLNGKSKWDSLIDEDEEEDLKFNVSVNCA
jgi:hypothetical protein